MIDRPIQMLLALVFIGAMVLLLRRTAPRRRGPAAGRLAGVAWFLLRLLLWSMMLLAVLVALEATAFVDANICVELSPGVEWCNHSPGSSETH